MAKQIGRLTDAAIRGTLKPGMHPNGDGLYLQVRGASKAWIFRYGAGARTHFFGRSAEKVVLLRRTAKPELQAD